MLLMEQSGTKTCQGMTNLCAFLIKLYLSTFPQGACWHKTDWQADPGAVLSGYVSYPTEGD